MDDRPSIGKYVIYTVVAGLADVAILFLRVQSLIEEWVQVGEITLD